MLNKKGLLFSLLFTFLLQSISFNQTISSIDTVLYSKSNPSFYLRNKFIIRSSLKIHGENSMVTPEILDPIEGKVILHDSLNTQTLIINYDYLIKGLPTVIGPQWTLLDNLDVATDSVRKMNSLNNSFELQKRSNVFSSGSLYRQISLSPFGGSDLNGGLQMQINGKLTDEMTISGILTDQDLPIQPEGTTTELDELDKVYLTLSHENFTIDAGDILYKNNNINRKLVGINNYFNFNDVSGSSVYAKSKGYFRILELKGRDGDQGPYQLVGKDGDREIIILSGTEKVWLDGRELTRGNNHDYTIDYSLAEINFTPNVLIGFDSDILVEYQYSDYEYNKGFIGGSMKKKWNEKGILEIGMYNEKDQYQEQALKNTVFDSLQSSSSGSLQLSTAVVDDMGEYIFEDNIFIYEPMINENDTINRYTVVFQYDSDGEYKREISDLGHIYYEYVVEHGRTQDVELFSPFRTVYAPRSHQFAYVNGNVQFNDHVSLNTKISGSILDKNSINSGNLYEGGSYMIGAKLDSIGIGPVLMNIALEDWKRGPQYRSMDRENDIMHTRLWNLDSSITKGIKETIFGSELILDHIGISKLEYASLVLSEDSRSRIDIEQRFSSKLFDHSFFQFIAVNNDKKRFDRYKGRIQLNMNSYSPFIHYLSENDPLSSRFWKSGIGMNITNENNLIRTGFDLRKDQSLLSTKNWSDASEDIIGFIQYDKRTGNGYKQNIIINKRIKSEAGVATHDYSLIDIDIGKYKANQPFQWEIQFRQEETLTKQRAIVYDSIGVGLGQYRFDPIFNSYISDPNGSYIAYTIPTGSRTPNTNFQGMQKLSLDLSRISALPNILLRANSRQEYNGYDPTLKSIFQIDVNDSSVSRLFFNSRIEAISSGKRRVTTWIENNNFLDGFDPRGNDLTKSNEAGVDLLQTVFTGLDIKNRFTLKSHNTRSSISRLRDRSMSGWWNDIQFQLRFNRSSDVNIGLMIGAESGIQQNNEFSVNAYGIKIVNKILYKDTGRFQTEISFVTAKENDDSSFIPPEAVNGYPIGNSFRSNTTLHYFVSRSISMVFSLNTIDDSRYKNFITFQGEVRAHF